MGTIGVQSRKFEKSEKNNFFQMIIYLFILDFLYITGVQYCKEDVEKKILVYSLCELDNLLLSYGCLIMIFWDLGCWRHKCVVNLKWVL